MKTTSGKIIILEEGERLPERAYEAEMIIRENKNGDIGIIKSRFLNISLYVRSERLGKVLNSVLKKFNILPNER